MAVTRVKKQTRVGTPSTAESQRRPVAQATPSLAAGSGGGDSKTAQVRRQVRIDGQRRWVGLERAFWTALAEICQAEHLSIDEACGWAQRCRPESDPARAIRSLCIEWMKAIGAGRRPI